MSVLIDFLREYDGKFDNLLYFFAFQYNLVQEEQLKRQVLLKIRYMINIYYYSVSVCV